MFEGYTERFVNYTESKRKLKSSEVAKRFKDAVKGDFIIDLVVRKNKMKAYKFTRLEDEWVFYLAYSGDKPFSKEKHK